MRFACVHGFMPLPDLCGLSCYGELDRLTDFMKRKKIDKFRGKTSKIEGFQ